MGRVRIIAVGAVVVLVALALAFFAQPRSTTRPHVPPFTGSTATPIKHLVVIFQENVSFDHYFATYPNAENLPGETPFSVLGDTPSVNGLDASLRAPNNPNSVQPFRLSPAQAHTCGQDHSYDAEQKAFDGGRMDRFVETVGRGAGDCPDYGYGTGLTMGYFDGNTVTALWNYAQYYAMNDNSFGTTFGPSTVGALNLISGQTGGFTPGSGVTSAGTVTGDPEPAGDSCASRGAISAMTGNANVGDLLSKKGVSWGWFQGGFADCSSSHASLGGVTSQDYVSHQDPFQYYSSTANLSHTPPVNLAEVGHDGAANHQYDLDSFWASVDAGSEPAVSFLKAPAYENGHAGYSTPLDEQRYLVGTLNRLQASPEWASTAVVIAYDDSDGWYDHAQGRVVDDPERAGLGPRLPLLVISPFARQNFVDHTMTDQTSVLRFIEDNWMTGRIGGTSYDAQAASIQSMFDFGAPPRPPLILDSSTGVPVDG